MWVLQSLLFLSGYYEGVKIFKHPQHFQYYLNWKVTQYFVLRTYCLLEPPFTSKKSESLFLAYLQIPTFDPCMCIYYIYGNKCFSMYGTCITDIVHEDKYNIHPYAIIRACSRPCDWDAQVFHHIEQLMVFCLCYWKWWTVLNKIHTIFLCCIMTSWLLNVDILVQALCLSTSVFCHNYCWRTFSIKNWKHDHRIIFNTYLLG